MADAPFPAPVVALQDMRMKALDSAGRGLNLIACGFVFLTFLTQGPKAAFVAVACCVVVYGVVDVVANLVIARRASAPLPYPIGKIVRDARRDADISLGVLARHLGLDVSTVSGLERGRVAADDFWRKLVDAAWAQKPADGFRRLPLDWSALPSKAPEGVWLMAWLASDEDEDPFWTPILKTREGWRWRYDGQKLPDDVTVIAWAYVPMLYPLECSDCDGGVGPDGFPCEVCQGGTQPKYGHNPASNDVADSLPDYSFFNPGERGAAGGVDPQILGHQRWTRGAKMGTSS